jgi:NADH-ubiquinone oxidoreductase chain 5
LRGSTALLKALLFMCAGGVIHSIGDSRDISFIGGLSVYIHFTSSSLIASNFALCGIPFLAGFYSRDFILEIFSIGYVNMNGFNSGLVKDLGPSKHRETVTQEHSVTSP